MSSSIHLDGESGELLGIFASNMTRSAAGVSVEHKGLRRHGVRLPSTMYMAVVRHLSLEVAQQRAWLVPLEHTQNQSCLSVIAGMQASPSRSKSPPCLMNNLG